MTFHIHDLGRILVEDHAAVFGENGTFKTFTPIVTRFIRLDGAEYKMVSGHLTYESSAGRHHTYPPTVVKCIDFDGADGYVEGNYQLYVREMMFFETVLPAFNRIVKIEHLVPKFWGSCATMAPSSNTGLIILECPNKGMIRFDCTTFVTAPRLNNMMLVIAQFHACSFRMRRDNPQFLDDPKLVRPERVRFEHTLPKLRLLLEHFAGLRSYAAHVARFRTMLDDFGHRLNVPFSAAARNHCWVLCHQAYSKVNLMFKHRSTQLPIVFNWQSMGVASLAVDLVIVLFVESNSMSKGGMSGYVREYHRELRHHCGDLSPSYEDIVEEMKKCIPFAFYVLADRIVSGEVEIRAEAPMFPYGVWRDYLMYDLFKFLIADKYL